MEVGITLQHEVTAEVSEFALARIEARAERDHFAVGSLLGQAVYHYVADKGSGRAAWAYPRFRREAEVRGRAIEASLAVDEDTLSEFAAAAAQQTVSLEQLVEHAALYFLADLDSGRVAERIVQSLRRT